MQAKNKVEWNDRHKTKTRQTNARFLTTEKRRLVRNVCMYHIYGTCINNIIMRRRKNSNDNNSNNISVHIDVQSLLDTPHNFSWDPNSTEHIRFFSSPLSLCCSSLSFATLCWVCVSVCYVAIYLTLDFNHNMIWSFTDDIYENETLNFAEISPRKIAVN